MKSLSDLLRVGYFFIIIKLINSYLLIAANLNDFRTIAKKVVPEDFANKLAQMLSNQGLVRTETSYDSGYDESDTSAISHPYLKGKDYPPKKSYKIQETKVDFDELVERVKKRLAEELKNKYLKYNNRIEDKNRQIKGRGEIQHGHRNKSRISFNKRISKHPTTERYEETGYKEYDETITEREEKQTNYELKIKSTSPEVEYADAMAEDEPVRENREPIEKKINHDYETVTNSDLYKEVDLIKKDSYEDYKTPKRDNIYASEETTIHYEETTAYVGNKRFKVQKNRPTTKRERQRKKYTIRVGSETISRETKDTFILTDAKEKFKAVKKGTMIPKRDLYTIVTPNYVDRIPNVVEKYNFDEPLPAKDREREEIRYIGNPPASINKKVRLL